MGIFVLLPIVIGVVVVAVQQQRERVRRAWTEAAGRLGLGLELGGIFAQPKMAGIIDGVKLEVTVYNRGSGDNSRTFTRYRALHTPFGPPVTLKRQGGWSFMRKFIGGVDVELGDPFFDSKVIVDSSDPGSVAEFLTPARRAAALQLFESYANVSISQGAITVEHAKAATHAGQIVGTVHRLLDMARIMTGAPAVDAALLRREGGELAAAARDLHTINEGDSNSFSQLLEVETLVELGDHDGALEVLDRTEGRIAGDSTLRGWRGVAERPPPPPRGIPQPPPPGVATRPRPPVPPPLVPTPPPLPTRTAPPQQEVIDDLFDRGLLSFEVVERFETTYAGSHVEWSGEVIGFDRYRTDLDFGTGPSVKATLLIGSAGESQMVSSKVHAVVAFADGTKLERGAHVGFQGELIRVDRLTRRFYVAGARLASR